MPLKPSNNAFFSHPRRWRELQYVYPVISRRSHGLSIGINLSPDAACSFDCVYCCADRKLPRPRQKVDLAVLEAELHALVGMHAQLFDEPEFRDIPASFRRLNDLAFSGNGEPTAVPVFPDAARIAADVRRAYQLDHAKIVLITNACHFDRTPVAAALAFLDTHGLEIWAKLDAGTDEYFRLVNRPSCSLQHVLDNLLTVACQRPIVVQSLFMKLHGHGPPAREIAAYADRLRWLLEGGAQLAQIQVYTVARPTAESFVTPLDAAALEEIATTIRPLGIPVTVYQ